MHIRSKLISLKVTTELLAAIDEAAKAEDCSRSDYIRQAVVLRLKSQQAIDKETDDFLEELRKLSQR